MKWTFWKNQCEDYYDFERTLYTMPDEQNTDVVMVLSFSLETRTAYYVLRLTNDNGNSVDWEQDHKLTWEDALKMVLSEGMPKSFPDELLEAQA